MTGRSAYRGGHHVSPRGVRIMRAALEEAARRIDGLEKFEVPESVAAACVEDGRPYEQFLLHLIMLGLEQWRDEERSERLAA